jgi:transcriptional regulator with XRE-family HTH domain
MPIRAVDRGRALGRRLVHDLCREIDQAARDRGLTYAAIGRAIGLSGSHVGRICRGMVLDVSLVRLAELATVVGLDLAARTYSGGSPLRDRAHLALLERLRRRLSPTLQWRTEVPVVAMAGTRDQRAWDATISGRGWLVGIEAETHVTDVQALQRRVALKQRDSGVDVVLIVLADTSHHQRLLASAPTIAGFTTPPRVAFGALGRGEMPPGSAVLSL